MIFKRKHNWLMCWLYLGTFGSFIGYAAGFPLLIKSQFPQVNALQYAWLGPLVGALVRPFGGWLADKLGGARVTFWNFVAMALAVVGVLYFLPSGGSGGSFPGFLAMFMLLFLTTGIGNGSTFRMIPVIFLTDRQRAAAGKGKEAARAGSARRQQGSRRRARLLLGDRRVRRLLHPEELRQLHHDDRRAGSRAVRVHCVLPDLHRGDVVVLLAARSANAVLSDA